MDTKKPIIVIVGQTASGKSALAIELAKKYDGEIIAADSRTIYKEMDIGTAKPALQEEQQIKHFGLNLISPDQTFSAAEFKSYACNVVKKIHKKNKIPFIVGGTGLYIDSLIYDFGFGKEADPELRAELEKLSLEELQRRAKTIGIDPQSISYDNKRHLSRAIERGGVRGNRTQIQLNVLMLGLQIDKEQLEDRITSRVGTMFNNGLVEEVQTLVEKYGSDAPGLLAPGYKAVNEYLSGRLSIDEAKELFIRYDRRLAKRQLTWFKRNQDIVWCSKPSEADVIINNFLTKFTQV